MYELAQVGMPRSIYLSELRLPSFFLTTGDSDDRNLVPYVNQKSPGYGERKRDTRCQWGVILFYFIAGPNNAAASARLPTFPPRTDFVSSYPSLLPHRHHPTSPSILGWLKGVDELSPYPFPSPRAWASVRPCDKHIQLIIMSSPRTARELSFSKRLLLSHYASVYYHP